MHLKILGINHTTAPVAIREQFSVGKEALRRGLENLDDYDGLSEAVILTTCNCTEIYAAIGGTINHALKNFRH